MSTGFALALSIGLLTGLLFGFLLGWIIDQRREVARLRAEVERLRARRDLWKEAAKGHRLGCQRLAPEFWPHLADREADHE
jgi:hypothetical protein